jgi:orotidine-5'-phosphate decarboxylase
MKRPMPTAKDRLIVALDVDSADRALDLFEALRETVGMFKIGSQLFTAAGPEIVRQIVAKDSRVFLDLKFHDIPNTVAAAAIEATRLGVSIFNLHALGGEEMMKQTVDAVAEVAAREALTKPKVIAVTVLTSLDQKSLEQIGISGDPCTVVATLARFAAHSGLDGVVASPEEIQTIRNNVTQTNFLIVTPGIRKGGFASDDQRRVMTAAKAIRAGADYLVVGRPILSADDPADAARKIVEEIDETLRERSNAL